MERWLVGAVLVASCLVGCESSGSGDSPGDVVPTRGTVDGGTGDDGSTDDGGTEGERPPEPPPDDPPGVPGGPVDYDSTLVGLIAVEARASVRGQLEDLCGADGCGVEVVLEGTGECTRSIGPDPVPRGGTVTVTARPCNEPETTDEETTGETTGDTTGDITDEPVPTT